MLKEKSAVEKAIIHGIEVFVVGAVAITAIIVFKHPLIDLLLRITNDPTVFIAILGLVSTAITAGAAFIAKWLRAKDGGLHDYVNE